MNYERPGNEIVEFSTKMIVLREQDEISNKIMNFQQQTRVGVGSFNIQNITGRNSVIYKIRGNRPKNYTLTSSCNVIEVNQSICIDVKLINAEQYTTKDIFEVKYIEFTYQLQQVYQKTKEQTFYDFWKYIEKNEYESQIKQTQLSVVLTDSSDTFTSQSRINNLIGVQMNKKHSYQFSSNLINSPAHARSASPSVSSASQSPFNQRLSKNSLFYSQRGSQNTPKTSIDQQMFQSQINNRHQSKFMSTSNGNNNILNGNGTQQEYNQMNSNPPQLFSLSSQIGIENDYKQLYEKLVIKVDEQDKQLFVLNQERKKLDQDWKLLSKKQEQLKNQDFQDQKLKYINGIKPISAIIIAIISLLIGILIGY